MTLTKPISISVVQNDNHASSKVGVRLTCDQRTQSKVE